MRRSGGLSAGLTMTLASLVLVACGGDDTDTTPRSLTDGSRSETTTAPVTGPPAEALSGDSRLSLAVLLVPDEAEEVVFTDVAAVKQRLGYADLTGQSPTFERFEFWERARSDGAMLTGTRLYGYSSVMFLDYGWTGEDVDWEVAWSSDAEECVDPTSCGDGGYVLGLRDDLDWNVVLNSLSDNGFVEDSEEPRVFATEDSAAPFAEVRLIPEIHGLAVGEVALPVADGDVPAAAADSLAPLVNRLGTPESAYLRPDCVDLATALGPDVTGDDLTAYFKNNDPSSLQAPLATGVGIDGRSEATVVMQYVDEATAAADVTKRETIINDWPSLQTGEAFSVVGVAGVRADAGYGFVDLDVTNLPLLAQMVLTDDAPWALCPANPPQ